MAAPEVLVPGGANNYRRWWNNSWDVVEKGGQRKSGPWTVQDASRLRQLVKHAHERGLWIRFYTLDGLPDRDLRKNGWDKQYNFGSKEKAALRWKASIDVGVDYLATDQYEEVAELLRAVHGKLSMDTQELTTESARLNARGLEPLRVCCRIEK